MSGGVGGVVSVEYNNDNFQTSRGLDGLQVFKLRTHEGVKSDIGTRRTGPKFNGECPGNLK